MSASENGHTPGPWEISGVSMNDGSVSIRHPEYRIVIACVTNAASFGDFVAAAMRGRTDFGAPDTAATQWANARLIAAAPTMLEALKQALLYIERDEVAHGRPFAAGNVVRAAISKATGAA